MNCILKENSSDYSICNHTASYKILEYKVEHYVLVLDCVNYSIYCSDNLPPHVVKTMPHWKSKLGYNFTITNRVKNPITRISLCYQDHVAAVHDYYCLKLFQFQEF